MPVLGCIADDFTGATDLGSMLVRGGLRTVQWLGVPTELAEVNDVDAVVISLKSRSVPVEDAKRDSLSALEALRSIGVNHYFFKYCSTFDSTDAGNIGPVAEVLLNELDSRQTVFCPAFPENGRTVYRGHLFVGDRLLSESGMESHPLNPMTDSDLRRVLSRQSERPVGLVDFAAVSGGASEVSKQLDKLSVDGMPLVIADALNDEHLATWAEAVVDFPLVTGGSALALHLAEAYRRRGLAGKSGVVARLPQVTGASVVLSGSCSLATQRQVAKFQESRPVFTLDPTRIANDPHIVDEAIAWSAQMMVDGPVLITSTAAPNEVDAARQSVGENVSALIECTFSEIAKGLVARGVRKLVVAGGETSGAVLKALGVSKLRIGPEIDPGVPWTQSLDEPQLALALKSGNFGRENFFLHALEMIA